MSLNSKLWKKLHVCTIIIILTKMSWTWCSIKEMSWENLRSSFASLVFPNTSVHFESREFYSEPGAPGVECVKLSCVIKLCTEELPNNRGICASGHFLLMSNKYEYSIDICFARTVDANVYSLKAIHNKLFHDKHTLKPRNKFPWN